MLLSLYCDAGISWKWEQGQGSTPEARISRRSFVATPRLDLGWCVSLPSFLCYMPVHLPHFENGVS